MGAIVCLRHLSFCNEGYRLFVGNQSFNIKDGVYAREKSFGSLLLIILKGDLLRARAKKRFVYALVVDTPANLPEGSDFTDESYLCYDLGYSDPTDLFAAHTHVHVCFAERIDEFALRDRCKENLKIIRQELEKREQEQENDGENT